jgi:phosphoribosyl-ATP pyrophosphohydrolase/phosphoribosyl-AMP cyclohydrolase
MNISNLNFDKNNGLIPAIIQHAENNQILMLGYMNRQSIEQTLSTGLITFFSRSRNEIWVKGAISGNFLRLQSACSDCDNDTLLIRALPQGPVCHTGAISCFGNENNPGNTLEFLGTLQDIVEQRKNSAQQADSYTASLFNKGVGHIARKVGEEATETIVEALQGTTDLLLQESADLLYHLMVLLSSRGLKLEDAVSVLQQRHRA